MSSVLARKRGVSCMEFYRSADELRTVLMRALMNDNITPKRWKPIFTFPVAEMLDDLFGHIFAAYNIYADTVEKVAEKRRFQSYALNDLDRIDDKLQQLLTHLYYGKIDADHRMPADIERAGELIDRCYDLISARRFVDEGIMTQEQAACSYMSWRGSLQKKNAHLSMQNMDNLYFALFAAKPWIKKKHHRKGIYHHDQTGNSGRNHRLQVPAC